jgi:hypothetical protein
MIEAGPFMRYQHYRPIEAFLTDSYACLPLGYVVVQAALVVAGLRSRWPHIRFWIDRTLKRWQLVGVCLVFLLFSAAPSRNLPQYLIELCLAAFIQAVNLGNIVLMVWVFPQEALVGLKRVSEKWFGQPGAEYHESEIRNPKSKTRPERSRRIQNFSLDRFALMTAAWVLALAALLSFFIYHNQPHIADELAYIYQARYLANGNLTMPVPSVPDAFKFYLIDFKDDRWFSATPPGWPAALAIGFLFGVPWLVNPVLAGLNVLLTYILIREIYNPRNARMAVILLCVSPWHLFMAMNFYTHTFMLTCGLSAAAAIAWARKAGQTVWAWLGGMAVGMGSLTRPLDGLIVGGLLGLWVIGLGGQRLKISSIGAFILGSILIGGVVLPYNKFLTGNSTVFPLSAFADKFFGPGVNDFGFGANRGVSWPLDPFPGHGPLDSLVNATLNIFSVNIELLGWSTGAVLLMGLLFFVGAIQKSDYLMLAVIAAVIGTYSFYWYSGGPEYGARYWYLILVPCIALTVSCIEFLTRTVGIGLADSNESRTRVLLAIASLCLLSLLNHFPWRAIDKYHHFLGVRPDIRRLAREYNFGKSLVLIRGRNGSVQLPDYISVAAENPLDLHASVPVYAWDRSPEVRRAVVKAYADRPIWIVKGPSLTNSGFQVVAGPLAASELLSREKRRHQVSLTESTNHFDD